MFNIGPEEILLILVIALVFLGPKRLPEVARQIGKGMREFRSLTARAQEELRTNLELPSDDDAAPPEATGTPGSLPDGTSDTDGAVGADASGAPDTQAANGAVKKPKAKKKKDAKPPEGVGTLPAEDPADGGASQTLDGAQEPAAVSSVADQATEASVDPGPVGAGVDPMERSG